MFSEGDEIDLRSNSGNTSFISLLDDEHAASPSKNAKTRRKARARRKTKCEHEITRCA